MYRCGVICSHLDTHRDSCNHHIIISIDHLHSNPVLRAVLFYMPHLTELFVPAEQLFCHHQKLGTKKIREHCRKYFEEQNKSTITRKRTVTKEFDVQAEVTVAKEEQIHMETVPEEP
ncbi:unnamed protein product [Caenorhabditis nigoni]